MKKILTLMTILLAMAIYVSAQEAYFGAVKPANHQTTQYQGNGSREWTGCLPCAIPEGEADIQDGQPDVVNGGCNLAVPIFTEIVPGDVFCGRGNQYDNYNTRDTDWYRYVLTETKTLFWTVIADFPVTIFIIRGPCTDYWIECTNGSIPTGSTGMCSAELAPGEYYFWVGPASWGPGYEGNYMVTLTEQSTVEPWCGQSEVPLSNWMLVLGGALIAMVILFRYRRIL